MIQGKELGEAMAERYLAIPWDKRISTNWGTGLDNSHWEQFPDVLVNGKHAGCYINGCMSIIDMDFEMAYLLEIVEHDSSEVGWLAVHTGTGGHVCREWFTVDRKQLFFKRSFTASEVHHWFVDWVEGTKEKDH